MRIPTGWPLRRSRLGHLMFPCELGISARSAAVSAIVVLAVFAIAGTALDAILYRSLLVGVHDATAGRVRDIAEALQSDSTDRLNKTLLATDHHVVAIQLIGPAGRVVERSGLAPETPLVPSPTSTSGYAAACPMMRFPMTTCG